MCEGSFPQAGVSPGAFPIDLQSGLDRRHTLLYTHFRQTGFLSLSLERDKCMVREVAQRVCGTHSAVCEPCKAHDAADESL